MSEDNTTTPDESLRPSGKRQRAGHAAAPAATSVSRAPEVVKTRRNPFTAIIDYLRGVIAEMGKVIWPTAKEMLVYTIVVLVFMVIITALVAGVDWSAAKLIGLVLS